MYTEAEGMKRRLTGVMVSERGSAMIMCGQDHIYIYMITLFVWEMIFVVMMMDSISWILSPC